MGASLLEWGWEGRGMAKLLPTTLVGSYPQPDWLVDRDLLLGSLPVRIRERKLWRVPEAFLEQAQDDATLLAIRDQERAGIDIVTDGEMRRESYSNRFATALDGVDADRPGEVIGRTGVPNVVPRVTGPIRRPGPIELRDLKFLRANTERQVKITIPGPFTMSCQAKNEFYPDDAAMARAFADAVREEIRDLFAGGADVVQLDEPWLQGMPQKAKVYGLEALNRALDGIEGTTCVHLCFGYAHMVHTRPSGYSYLPELAGAKCDQISIETAQSALDCAVLRELPGKTILLGALDLSTPEVETAETVAARIRRALPHVAAERIVVAPDCGMKYLPRAAAFGKLKAMAEGAAIVRRELGAG